VGDGHHAALEVDQQVFQPLDRVQVQVVGRLVEQQHVGAHHQRLGQRHAFAGAAGQGADHGFGVQVQAVDGFLDPLRPVPAVERLDLALHRVQVAVAVGVALDQLLCAGDTLAHGGEDTGFGVEHGLLGDVGDTQALLQLQDAVIGLFHAGEDFQQRGLAGAVAADEAHPFGGFDGQVGVVEECNMAEGELGVEEGDECHGWRIIRCDIDEAMTNICRCGTYQRIRVAIKRAAGVAS
jgi:hypothetical protein